MKNTDFSATATEPESASPAETDRHSDIKRAKAGPNPGATGRGSLIENPGIKLGLKFVIPAIAIIAWELLAKFGILSSDLPPPSQVARAFVHWVFGSPESGMDLYAGTWWAQVYGSLQRVVFGFALAVILGVPLGLLIGASRIAYLLMDHLIQGLRTVPAPAWVPFGLVLFGLSRVAAIWLVFIVAFFPIVVNTVSGVQQVPILFRHAARMLGASTPYVWRRILLPAALPFVFVGIRIAVGMAWIAVVVSELVGVNSGLGYTLYEAYQFGRMDIMIATMVTLGVFGLLSDRAVALAGRLLMRGSV